MWIIRWPATIKSVDSTFAQKAMDFEKANNENKEELLYKN